MIRTAIIAALFATPAAADGDAAYMAAIQEAIATSQTEYAAFYDFVGEGTYDVGQLESEGELLRYGVGDAAIRIYPELIAVYDHDARTCTWGHDSDIYAKLPRTASMAVRDHAVAQSWPDHAIVPVTDRQGACTSRSLLASTIGDLDYIDVLRFGDQSLYLGFPNYRGES